MPRSVRLHDCVETRALQAGERRSPSEHTYVAHNNNDFADDGTRRNRLHQMHCVYHAGDPRPADTETDFPVVDLEVA